MKLAQRHLLASRPLIVGKPEVIRFIRRGQRRRFPAVPSPSTVAIWGPRSSLLLGKSTDESVQPQPLKKSLDKWCTNMIISVMLARQISLLDPLLATLTPLLRYSCRLFVAPKNIKSFAIKQIRTLRAKYRGWCVSVPFDIPTFKTSDVQTLFCTPFVFITLRIAAPATPLHSGRYELPGVWGTLSRFSRITSHG